MVLEVISLVAAAVVDVNNDLLATLNDLNKLFLNIALVVCCMLCLSTLVDKIVLLLCLVPKCSEFHFCSSCAFSLVENFSTKRFKDIPKDPKTYPY